MKLVFLNQYFPPDIAPTGLMLERIAEELIEQGHEVTILCAKGGYASITKAISSKEEEKKYQVLRIGATGFGRETFLGKLVDYAGFYLGAAWKLAFLYPKPERFIALTTPPFLSVIVRLISKIRGGDHASWVMDLYPDVLVAHGIIRSGGWNEKLLKCFTRIGFGGSRCAGVWSLGPDMEPRVARYLKDDTPSEWIALWGKEVEEDDLDEKANQVRNERGWGSNDLVVMYSGNLGLGHSFDEILEVAKSPNPSEGKKKVRFSFHGNGKRRVDIERFQREFPDAPVELHGYEAKERLNSHLRSADVHLVSLNPAWDGTMVPSKLQGIFAVGRPVILIGSKDSSIGQWVTESGGGWIVPPGDPEGLASAITAAGHDEERVKRGQAAMKFSQSAFSRDTNSRRYAEAFARGA